VYWRKRLRLVRIAKYGPGSEKLSDAQLELLELEPGVSRAEVQAESERPAVQPSTKTKHQHRGGRNYKTNAHSGVCWSAAQLRHTPPATATFWLMSQG